MKGLGGVANYYSHIYPLLRRPGMETAYLAIGQTRSAVRYIHPLADQVRFARELRRYRPELVHINPSLNLKSVLRDGMFCFQALRRCVPVLVFFRGWDEGFERSIRGIRQRLFTAVFGRAALTVVLAGRFRDRLRAWGVTGPVCLATTAVPDRLLENLDIETRLSQRMESGTTRVLYLGRLEREKGVLETVRAVLRLAESGHDVVVTVAGDGPLMPELVALRDSSELAGKVIHIAGYVRGREKAQVLETHHVYSFPSIYGEGMPNALLECMLFGMPVITCPTGGTADFFEDGRMGRLLERPSEQGIADGILYYHQHREQMQVVGRYNHRYARANFMATHVADKLCDCYRQALRPGSSLESR